MTRILVIEDEPQVRENITQMLELADFEAIAAEDGQRGIELANQQKPDLIICDIMMPKVDGYGVLNAIRNETTTENIPLIFLSAKADRSDLRQGMELGADDYLTKPFTTNELLQAIKTRLDKRKAAERRTEERLEELRLNITRSLPHELHTPLNGIIGLSQMLIMDHGMINEAEGLEIAEAICDSAKRLYRMTQNFLLYAELEVMSSDPKRVDYLHHSQSRTLTDLVITEGILQAGNTTNRSNDIQLDLQEGVVVPMSELMFKKVVEELLDNALKFSEPGTPVRLVSKANDQNAFNLFILDRGRGMTPDQIERVGAYLQFERKLYEQQGSGLGLAIAKRIIELHGGTLILDSIPEQQTLVHVTLPHCFIDAGE